MITQARFSLRDHLILRECLKNGMYNRYFQRTRSTLCNVIGLKPNN